MNWFIRKAGFALVSVFCLLAAWPAAGPVASAKEQTDKADVVTNELRALQGAWKLLTHEEQGTELASDETQLVTIVNDKITWKRKGEVIMEGTIELDPIRSPKHLNYQFISGRSDQTIYIRVGDYFIQCGRRDGKTRPSEFATGTANGGEYLIVLKREK